MVCSACGTANDPGRKFCIECGSRLAQGCPTCGTVNPPSAKFCGECATPLSSVQAAASAAPRGVEPSAPGSVAERRVVSVLFADLVGFTPFAEERDAEEVRDTLSRYFDLASDVIGRYGGTVEKFIGDAVMAVWGAPSAHEDDAERAVRAGLELVAAVRGFGPSIEARAGILTGEAAVTIGATNQGLVAGDLVNTASRLQSVAPPGSVLVGEATHRAASRAIAFEEVGPQLLKGKAAPVPAWRALRVVAEVGGRNRSGSLEAPFVGRDDELRLLKDLFHATSREGRARLVSVIGPAGIGKTRLAWEFLKYLDGLIDTVWFHEGRSPAYGDGLSFWALGEMVRRRAGLLESDDAATTRVKVTAMLEEHVPDAEERRWIEPALLSLLGIEASIGPEPAFAAWRTFFERLAATAPVVMVFEDAHFADEGVLDFIDHLLEWSRQLPIYVVTLARPELLERRPDWGVRKRNFTSLYLEPLGAAAMRELLLGLVPDLPEPAVRAVIARADGIPLYAVETVRMLQADGKLLEQDGAYRVAGDLGDLAVPETLTALIASRLDALDPGDRAVLLDAAVLGSSFSQGAVEAVSAVPEDEIDGRLEALARRELIRREADPRSPEYGQYVFLQALIREVAYNTLSRPDRRVRHLAAARYFESLGSDELAGALAGQYLAAHDNTPAGPERDALAGQARIALRAAAERAAALGAHGQAIRFCDEALRVTTDPAERAALHERAGRSATVIQDPEDADRHLRAAIEARASTGDRPGEAAAIAYLGEALLTGYRFGPAMTLLEEAWPRFADLRDEPATIRLHGQLARGYFLTDASARSVAEADLVLEAAERLDLVEIVADTLITRGSALAQMGRLYEGIGAIEAGRRLAADHDLVDVHSRALINLASYDIDRDPRASLEEALEGIELARRIGERSFQLADNAFVAAIRTGRWDTAEAVLEPLLADEVDDAPRAVALSDSIELASLRGAPTAELVAQLQALPAREGDTVIPSTVAWARAWVAIGSGDFESARTSAAEFAEHHPGGAADAYLIVARCACLLGDVEGAQDAHRIMTSTARKGRAFDADRIAVEAAIAAIDDRRDDALKGYRRSIEIRRELGLDGDLALGAVEMAMLLGPDEPDVRAAAAVARPILARLGARPSLDRLDAAMGGSAPDAAAPLQVDPDAVPTGPALEG